MNAILVVLIITRLFIAGYIAQEDCPVRVYGATNCGTDCSETRTCRKAGRQCECAVECGWSCIRKGCTILRAPENGNLSIIPSDRSIGSKATFTCHNGYVLQGTSTRLCQEDKTWSGEDDVSCGCIKNTGEVSRLGLTCGRECPSDSICRRAVYQCICDGVCGKSCIPLELENHCDSSLLNTDHATYTVEPSTAVYGSIARYTCADGYIPTRGDSERTCTGGGGWSGSALICNPEHVCNNPPVVEHASHNGSKEYYLAGELLVYRCDFGYSRGNSFPWLRCQQTGDTVAWGNLDMTCTPKSCGYPGDINHGRIEGNVYSFQSSVTYVCDNGYRIQGRATRYCQSDQQWSGSLPQCIPVQCPSMSAPEDGVKHGSGRGYNDDISFTCNNGFILDRESTLTCQNDGTWSSPVPTCKAISDVCSMPQDPSNGQWRKGSKCRDGQYQLNGCELTYTCNEEYIPASTDVVYVCSEPEWDEREVPVCRPKPGCTVLRAPENGNVTINPSDRSIGSEATFTCQNDYVLQGTSTRVCQEDKTWSGEDDVSCTDDACYNPPVVEHAYHNSSKEFYLAGELLAYSCDLGYSRGNSIPWLRCQQTGDTVAWENFDMTCTPKSCGYPGDISHGRIEGNVYSYLSSVTYVCDNGYIIQGIATRHCQSDQQWSGSLPHCIPAQCRRLSAPEDGVIFGSNRGSNDEVSFTCNNGFILDGASTVRCQNDETWSSLPPTCKAMSDVCSMPQDPSNGQWRRGSKCRDGQYQLKGCELTYTCNEEYIPSNTDVVYVCNEPEWDETEVPVCSPKPDQDNYCNPCLLSTSHATYTVEPPTAVFGSIAGYTCANGFIAADGNSERTCTSGKVWSGSALICVPERSCYNPPVVENAIHNGSKEYYLAGEQLVYICDYGYSRGNSLPWLMCQQTGDIVAWGNFDMTCLHQENYCNPSLLSTSHATYTIEPPTAVFGSVVRYTCANGFIPAGGNSERTCTLGEVWSGSALICVPKRSCYNPPVVENAQHNGRKEYYLAGELLAYICDVGYRRGNSATFLRCQQTGDIVAWGKFDMTCLPVQCRSLSAPENGVKHGSNRGSNDVVFFNCNNGFILDGASTLTCQNDETWSSPPPTCKEFAISEVCSMPQDPPNGQWRRRNNCREGKYQLNGCKLKYTCNKGYIPANAGVVYVCSGADWDIAEEPVCYPDHCNNSNLKWNMVAADERKRQGSTRNSRILIVGCEGNRSLKYGLYLLCSNGKWKGNAFCI